MACLLQDLASGFMSGKLLQKLDTSTYILAHHTSDNFAFLDDPVNARNRTTFYHTLARMLFMDESASKFKSFVAPLQQVGSLQGAPLELDLVTFAVIWGCWVCFLVLLCMCCTCSRLFLARVVGGLSVAHKKSTILCQIHFGAPAAVEQSAGASQCNFL